jgi:AraC family transcriptional regulator
MQFHLWEWKPYFMDTIFWHKKAKFQLKKDIYQDWIMFAVEEGAFHYSIGDVAGTARFGDAILCPPGIVFEREVAEPVTFHFITLGWQWDSGFQNDTGKLAVQTAAQPLMPESVPFAYEDAVLREQQPAMPKLPVHLTWTDGNRLSSTYFYIHQLDRLENERKSLLWNHYLQDLWQQFRIEHELAKTHHQQLEQSQLDPVMLEAATWLQQHAFQQVVLKQLSVGLGLSSVQFTRRFQATHGITPIDYLTSLRIQKARALLLETGMTLEQIAERCGYESGFYLSRVFSRKMKLSPSQYRRTHRV